MTDPFGTLRDRLQELLDADVAEQIADPVARAAYVHQMMNDLSADDALAMLAEASTIIR